MIKHGERAAVNSRLAEAVDRHLHKNICQTKHRTLYRRGQAVFAARTRGKTEVSDLLDLYHVYPDIRFTTWEDFDIMAMVEKGMEISILPDLILMRVPYKIEIRPLEEPYYRSVGLAMKNRKNLTPAVQKFIEYLPFRETE
ncbi:MAG TPA: LysR substrate-binding domain-containing protein [Oscillospiraceae bacterium]|nr:LysR substrate-binding domain-containing protein [Oscillospiraceae bacterium]